MTFAAYYMGKPIEALEFASDLEPFIRKEEPESQTLEYKSAGSPLSEHGNVISAFLNSGGGLLILGAPREVDLPLEGGRTSRVCRGPFTPLQPISKDDARRSLISKISPLPVGVLVGSVPCEGGCVVVVDVETSTYPPHQHDGTYWIRLDGETRRAPHALVESLFLQRRGPNLECQVVVIRSRPVNSPDRLDRFELDLRLVLMNRTRNIAEYVAVDLKTDRLLAPSECRFQPEDPQPADLVLPPVFDQEGRRLQRYRLRSDVMHAYSYKSLLVSFQIAREYAQGRLAAFAIELQAKDMLRKRYEFEVVLDFPYRRDQLVEPAWVESPGLPA